MDELVVAWQHEGRIITFSWVGDTPVPLRRVYALAFTETGEMLLVGDDSGTYWLPGGGVEAGETATEALERELLEEAAATIRDLHYLGAQCVDDPLKPSEHHGFYGCRVQLADNYAPTFEITARLLIPPDRFLDTLFWGRDDPKAALLLEKALTLNMREQATPPSIINKGQESP